MKISNVGTMLLMLGLFSPVNVVGQPQPLTTQPSASRNFTSMDRAVYDVLLADLHKDRSFAQKWRQVTRQGELALLHNETFTPLGEIEEFVLHTKKALPAELKTAFTYRNQYGTSLAHYKPALKMRLISRVEALALYDRNPIFSAEEVKAIQEDKPLPRRVHYAAIGFGFSLPGYTKDSKTAFLAVETFDSQSCMPGVVVYVLKKQGKRWKVDWKG